MGIFGSKRKKLKLCEISYDKGKFAEEKKPVLYLYPEEITDVKIKLTLKNSKFTCIYPKFNESENTWKVKAYPNGDISIMDKKYPYLFWEADSYVAQDLTKGFVVKAEMLKSFLKKN